MRLWISLLSAVLAISLATSADATVGSGDRAAEFSSVKSKSGGKLKLKKFRGKVVVLTFGASWCKPCGKELPAYEKLSKKYSKKDVVFVAINIDSSIAVGKKFVRKSGLKNVVVGFDPKNSSVKTWNPPKMPSTFIIDRKGIVRMVHKGYEAGDERDIAVAIKKYK